MAVVTLSAPRTSTMRLEDLHGKPVRLSELWRRGSNAVVVLPARARQDCKARHGCAQPDLPLTVVFDPATSAPARLIDPSEKVRREFADQPLDDILTGTANWLRGMRTYEAQCARCHGADGADTAYPNVKSLAGAGQRYSVDEIIERMTNTGNTDLSALNDEAKRALAGYVATF
jgi:hypothetical protein